MLTSRACLEIGFWGNLKGSRYQIIGGSNWSMDYQEYYTGSESSGYERAYWNYTEWVLREESTGNIAYLVEDKEGFAFSQLFDAPNKVIPEALHNQFANFRENKQDKRIIEYGKAKLLTFEGENGYNEPENPLKSFFLYKDDNSEKYSLEIPINKEGYEMTKQREYYIDSPTRFQEITKAFEENPAVKRKKIQVETLKLATLLSALACWFLFGCFIYAFFPEKKIFSHSIEVLSTALEVDSVGKVKMDTLVEFYTPEWEVKQPNQLYLLEIDAKLGTMPAGINPAEMFVQAAIIDREEGVVNQVLGDFWEEYGHDSDGSWRENNRNASMYVRAEKAGKYSAWVSVERTPAMLSWGATIEVNVYKYQLLWWYMLTYYFIALIINLILMGYSKSYK